MNKTLWLARLLYNRGNMSKEEILDAWRDQDAKSRPMPESTFYENRRNLEAMFGLKVECRGGRYSLSETPGNALPDGILATDGSEASEKSESDLWLPMISEAINERQKLRMEYAPPDKPPYVTDLSPYCLHSNEGFRYVVGYSAKHASIRTFATDRIPTLTVLPSHFRRPAGFSREQWFANSAGAFGGPGIKPQHIIIEPLTTYAREYLKSRPLHSSQRLTESATHRPLLELDVCPTRDFIGRLLSFGGEVRVVEPLSLKQAILKEAEAICRESRL